MKVGNGYWLFMAEAEGMDNLVNTHTAKLNAIVKEIKHYPAPSISAAEVQNIAYRHRISNLTDADWKYIQAHL